MRWGVGGTCGVGSGGNMWDGGGGNMWGGVGVGETCGVQVPPTYLVSPLIYHRHVDIIHKHRHLPSCRGAIGATHTLVHISFYGTL